MEKMYDEVVKNLMANDKNGAWDEILGDVRGDYEVAKNILVSSLERIINEEGLEGNELKFYQDNLFKLKY